MIDRRATIRRRLLREIKHFQARMAATTTGTSAHSRARNCCRDRIRQLMNVDHHGTPAHHDGIVPPPGAEYDEHQ